MMSEDNKERAERFKPLRFITEKIRNKVLVILLGSALGTLIVAVVALVSINIAQQTIDEVVDRKGAIVTLANNAEIELLLARELDQRYLLNYRALGFENARGEYVSKVEQHVQRVGEIFDEIQQKDPGSEVILQNIDDARKNLRDYLSSFLNVVNLSEQRGYKDLGLIGEFSGDIRDVEETLSGTDQPNLLVTVQRIRGYEKDYLLLGERQYIRRVADEVANLQQQVERSLLADELRQKVSILADEYLNKFQEVVDVDRQIADGARVYRSAINNMIPTLTTVVEAVQADQAVAITAMKQQSRIALIVVVVASVVTILLGIGAAFFFSRRLTKQIDNIMDMFGNIGMGDFSARADILTHDELGEMAESLNAMLDNTLTLIQSREERDAIQASIMRLLTEISDLADGDLTARAEVTEEVTGAIADSFNNMAEQLSRVVKDVKEASMLVGSSSADVDQVTQKLSQASEEQAAKISDAITTIESIAQSIREVADSATESARVSSSARNSAREGSDAVRKTNQAMSSIKENMRGTARTIKRLGESSQEIGNIIQIINDIADRTSILALNASIQAAMAGEAGRGFAVVADEVRALASRTQASTEEIRQTIEGLKKEVVDCVGTMRHASELAQHQVDSILKVETELQTIAAAVREITGLNEEMESAANEQSEVSDSINQNVIEISRSAEQTSSDAQETARIAGDLLAMAETLRKTIEQFRLSQS